MTELDIELIRKELQREKSVHIQAPPAEVELYIYAKVTSPEGNILWEMPERKSRSFVQNFLIFIGAMFDGLTTDATDSNNTTQFIFHRSSLTTIYFKGNGALADDVRGIIVGSNNIAEDNTDYWMGTQIVDGSGAGELMYNVQQIAAPAVVGANVDMEYKRVFTNLSGGAVTVEECGVAVRNTTYNKSHLIARDLLSASVDDNCSLLIMYTWRTTV